MSQARALWQRVPAPVIDLVLVVVAVLATTDPADARVAIKELKALQDVLGTFQDSEAQREALYSLATDMMASDEASARTIFAMGEIAARLQADQDTSRAQFAVIFERFSRRSAQRRTAEPGPRRSAPVEPAIATAGAAQ